jgi:HK97 family phage major capsid protein
MCPVSAPFLMGTNGAALTNLDPVADAISTVLEAGGNPSAIVTHPRTWRSILKLKEQTSGNNKPLISVEQGGVGEAPRLSLYGLPVFLSKQLSITETQGTASNASSAYVYDASQLLVVMRNDVRVERDSSRLFNSDQSEVRGLMRADFVPAQAAAVVRILGIIP